MKKTIFRRIAAVLMVFVLLFGLCGCSTSKLVNNREVRAVLQDFVESCNTMDAEGALACIAPSKADPVRAILRLFGTDSNAVFAELLNLLGNFGDITSSLEDDMKSIQLDIHSIEFREDMKSCVVTAELIYESFDSKKSDELLIEMINTGDIWYINGLLDSENVG